MPFFFVSPCYLKRNKNRFVSSEKTAVYKYISFVKSAFSGGFIFRESGESTYFILILMNVIQGSSWNSTLIKRLAFWMANVFTSIQPYPTK